MNATELAAVLKSHREWHESGGKDGAGADLDGAYLDGAYLDGAYLDGADLDGAYLDGAYLDGAKNAPASLADHNDPETPYERKTIASTRAERMARYREQHPDVPVIEHLDAAIMKAVSAHGCVLDMSTRHSCETTHCRAGWAIHLAGPAGYELEKKLGSAEFAGRAIYRASTGRVPHFFATTERALEDIKRCAAEDPLPEMMT